MKIKVNPTPDGGGQGTSDVPCSCSFLIVVPEQYYKRPCLFLFSNNT